MSELNLKQITDKLNTEFTGEVRKLVFWYDAGGEFAEDVDSLGLVNAEVLHLARDNQFYTKYFLEWVDKTTNYLVYAPFAKPPLRENHLADTMRYSKEFVADRASLLIADLGLEDVYKRQYQYYNIELKDETFALLKKNVKITKERIPAATQLFTPDWIVRYMVENSLGRLWVEGCLLYTSRCV